MRQSDLQKLYDENEADYQQQLLDYPRKAAMSTPLDGGPSIPPPGKEPVRVRYGDNPGWVATYSGEDPPRYLVRLERKVIDPDNPDYGPASSRWFLAEELEVD